MTDTVTDPYIGIIRKLNKGHVRWYYDVETKETIVEEGDRTEVEEILIPEECKLLVFKVREKVDEKLWTEVEFKLVLAGVEFICDSMDFSMKHVVVDKWKEMVEQKILTAEECGLVRFKPMPQSPVIQGRYGGWVDSKTGQIHAKIQYELI